MFCWFTSHCGRLHFLSRRLLYVHILIFIIIMTSWPLSGRSLYRGAGSGVQLREGLGKTTCFYVKHPTEKLIFSHSIHTDIALRYFKYQVLVQIFNFGIENLGKLIQSTRCIYSNSVIRGLIKFDFSTVVSDVST